MNNTGSTHSNRIEYIDVWRCLAILLVVFSHVIYFSHPWYKEVFPGLVWRASPLGGLGVRLFFCISGFVICRGMLKESTRTGTVNLPAFYVRRAFRIFPPLLFYIAALGALSMAGWIGMTPDQALFSAGFLCNVSLIDCGWFLGHTWSLAFEEQFYLVFPLLFLLLGVGMRRHRLLSIAVVMLTATLAVQITGHDKVGYVVSVFAFMVWGCVFAVYWDGLKSVLSKIPVALWLLATSALFLAHMTALPESFHKVIFPAFGPLVCCILIFGTPFHHPAIRSVFGNPKLQYVGRMSYSIYLWQQLATSAFGFSSPLPTLFFVLLVFIISHLSFRYFESRMVAVGARISARLSHAGPALAGDTPAFSGAVRMAPMAAQRQNDVSIIGK